MKENIRDQCKQQKEKEKATIQLQQALLCSSHVSSSCSASLSPLFVVYQVSLLNHSSCFPSECITVIIIVSLHPKVNTSYRRKDTSEGNKSPKVLFI